VSTAAPKATLRAAIYCRVSTTDQEREGTSLETQEAACRRYAEEHGYTVSEAHVYRETYSGAEFHDRPRLGELRAALRGRALDVVIAYAVDRLSRDQVHIWLLLDEIERGGARLEMVTETFDDTPTGKFLLSARAFAAEVEREKIRERSGRAKLALARAGKLYAPGPARYGYRHVRQEYRREIYEPEATVVRDIFESFGARGEPLRAILRRLNETGVPSPAVGKRNLGRSTRWVPGTIHRMLIDPMYKGETYAFRWKGRKRGTSNHSSIRPRDQWIALPANVTPAIVSRELWDAAQIRLETNRGEAARNVSRPYLLRGLMICAVCGRKLRPSRERARYVYRCASRETPAGPCGARRVPGDEVEQWAWDEVCTVLRDPAVITREREQARRRGNDAGLTASLETARRRLAKVEQGQARLMERFRRSDDFPWELVEKEVGRAEVERTQILAEIATLETRIAARQQSARQWEAAEAYCQRVAGRLDALDFDGRRLAIEALAVRVTANGRDWQLDGGIPLADGYAGILSSTRIA
jgi:site-specific DNA recombinase